MSDGTYRRAVFYFHGFDRRGPRYFNLWQKREARAYVTRHGGDLSVGDLNGASWSIRSGKVETDFHFMDWTPVIRPRFEQPFWVGMGSMLGLGAEAFRQGLFGKIRRADHMMGLLTLWAFLPMIVFIFALLVAAFFGGFAVIMVAVLGVLAFWLLHRFDSMFGVYYALNIAWATRRMALRDDPEFEAIIASFQDRFRSVNADEIVCVGHSIGGALAVRLFDQAPETATLLTVGQSVPLVSFQAEAVDLRAKLTDLGRSEGRWIDVSAGRDPLGFCGFDPSDGGAVCVSAHLGRSFGVNRLRALKWRGFDMHFLYFNAVENAGACWDWFAILGDDTPLWERFGSEKRQSGKGERRGWF